MISIWLHTYFKSLMLLHVVLRGYLVTISFAHRVSMIKTVHVFVAVAVAVAWPLCVCLLEQFFGFLNVYWVCLDISQFFI